MTVHAQRTYPRPAFPGPPQPLPPAAVADLRGSATTRELRFPAGDLLVVSGLPGSGKSTLIRRAVPGLDARGGIVWCVDSQDARDRWARRVPPYVPYGLYRPLVRLSHYTGLRRALRSGTSVVVHDCGTLAWVRHWLARHARRRGVALRLLLLDVPAADALAGQARRGRRVSAYAFARHRRAVARLVAAVETGPLPAGVTAAVLLDRPAADALRTIRFGPLPPAARP
ncbi:AAA family ATPase [Streptomyces varsoviensis]|uniref:AAA family ATPase n=1 Tax=Streptomyces varsoviensis TaxID=67373 RepID=UPI003F4CDD0B